MKVLTNAALVALLAASIGVAGLVPSYAAPGATDATSGPMGHHHRHPGQHRQGFHGGRGAGLGATLMRLGCSDRSHQL